MSRRRRKPLTDAQFQAHCRRLIARFERRVREGAVEVDERMALRESGFIYVRTYTVQSHIRVRKHS